MLELAIEDNPFLTIETIELERGGKSYTYDTMKALTQKILTLIITLLLAATWSSICRNGIKSMN